MKNNTSTQKQITKHTISKLVVNLFMISPIFIGIPMFLYYPIFGFFFIIAIISIFAIIIQKTFKYESFNHLKIKLKTDTEYKNRLNSINKIDLLFIVLIDLVLLCIGIKYVFIPSILYFSATLFLQILVIPTFLNSKKILNKIKNENIDKN